MSLGGFQTSSPFKQTECIECSKRMDNVVLEISLGPKNDPITIVQCATHANQFGVNSFFALSLELVNE